MNNCKLYTIQPYGISAQNTPFAQFYPDSIIVNNTLFI